jgi:hypothetical protein
MERPVLFKASAIAEISIDLDLRSPRPGFSQYGYNAEKDVPEFCPHFAGRRRKRMGDGYHWSLSFASSVRSTK